MADKSDSWLEITVAIPGKWGDLVAGYMFEMGATAVEECNEGDRCVLVTHYPFGESANTVVAALGGFLADLVGTDGSEESRPKVDMRKIEGRQWALEARKNLKPALIQGNLWAVPTWTPDDEMPDGEILWIDPGEAFGTGIHPTTRMAAQLLAESVGQLDKPRVLDVGTGTGILAMTAQRAGAGYVLATDNDPKALEVASDNFKANSCIIEISGRSLEEITETFDIFAANILLETLLEMAPHFKRLAGNGGSIILSGLLVEQEDSMVGCMKNAGFTPPEKRLEDGEWLALRFVAP